jgi:hypothetical protein
MQGWGTTQHPILRPQSLLETPMFKHDTLSKTQIAESQVNQSHSPQTKPAIT